MVRLGLVAFSGIAAALSGALVGVLATRALSTLV